MTNQQIVALGVRLFCIWLAVYVLRDLPGLWTFGQHLAHDSRMMIGLGVYIAIVVLTVAALWAFPLAIARKLLPRAAQEQPVSLAPVEQMQRVGFCLLGLWLLTLAIPGLAYEVVLIRIYTRPGSTLELQPQHYAALAQSLVELVLAVWLLFGARGLLGILRQARTAGSVGKTVDGES